MFKEECADALPLIGIGDSKRHLGTRGGLATLVQPKIATHTDNVFRLAFPQGRSKSHIPCKVKLSKVAQFFVRQPLFGLEKAKIDGAATQALKESEQTLLIIGPDRPDVDRATIA